jgi:hypothetical protein
MQISKDFYFLYQGDKYLKLGLAIRAEVVYESESSPFKSDKTRKQLPSNNAYDYNNYFVGVEVNSATGGEINFIMKNGDESYHKV